MQTFLYYAFIISSLKEDFTGYHIDPLTLLKLEISDYEKYEEIYTACAKKDSKTDKRVRIMFGITSLQYFIYVLVAILTSLVIIWIVRKNMK